MLGFEHLRDDILFIPIGRCMRIVSMLTISYMLEVEVEKFSRCVLSLWLRSAFRDCQGGWCAAS